MRRLVLVVVILLVLPFMAVAYLALTAPQREAAEAHQREENRARWEQIMKDQPTTAKQRRAATQLHLRKRQEQAQAQQDNEKKYQAEVAAGLR